MKKLQAFSLVSLLVLVTIFASCSFNTIIKQKSNKTSIVLEFPQLQTGTQSPGNRAVINKTSYLYLFTIEKDTNLAKLFGPYSVSLGKKTTITDIEEGEYSFFCIINTAEKEDDLESELIDVSDLNAESLRGLFTENINSAATAIILENKTIIAGTNTISETLIPLVQEVNNIEIEEEGNESLSSDDSPVFYKITNVSDNNGFFSFPTPQSGTVILYDANGKRIETISREDYTHSQQETPNGDYIFVYLDKITESLTCNFVEDLPNTTGQYLVRSNGLETANGTKKPTTIKHALQLIGEFSGEAPNKGFEIILLDNITLTNTIEMNVDKKITIKSNTAQGVTRTITADDGLNNSLFNITKGEIVFDTITIGRAEGEPKDLQGAAINVKASGSDEVSLTLKNTTIQNFSHYRDAETQSFGGGIYIEGSSNDKLASLILTEGSVITDCSAGYGGGVIVFDNSIFTMNGGEISNNFAEVYGGGVCVYGTFTMNGGSITENEAERGGGVYVDTGATINLDGGSITENSATGGDYAAGGGLYSMVYIEESAIITVIKNNTADSTGTDNIYIYNGP